MPKLRRRTRTTGAISVGMGTLLADEDRARVTAANAAAEAERQAAKRTNEASSKANTLVSDYDSGVITHEEFVAGITAIRDGAENAELRAKLDSALRVGAAKNQMNLIDAKTREFNAGTLKYGDYKKFLEGQNTTNTVIKEAVAKNLAGARTSENSRVMTVSYQDYINGKIDIKQYQNALGELRNAPGQTPADLDTITKAIDGARTVEGQMNDNRTYADWQTGKISAGAAMAYFNARIASAKTPQELDAATKMLANIVNSSDSSTRGSGTALTKLIDENNNKSMEAYFNNVVKPGIAACNGDPVCVTGLYDGYAQQALTAANRGGTNAQHWFDQFKNAGLAGAIAASNAMHSKIMGDHEKAIALAKADVNASPESRAATLRDAAMGLRALETSAFTTEAQKAEAIAKITEDARQIQQILTEAMTERTAAQQNTQGTVQRLYDNLVIAIKNQTTTSSTMAQAGIPITKTPEGATTVDLAAFAEWLQENMARNAQLAYDLGNAKKTAPDADSTARKELETLLSTSTVANQDVTNIARSLYQTQFPGATPDQIKAAAQRTNETNTPFTSRGQFDEFMVNIGSNPGFGGAAKTGDNWARDPRTELSGLMLSIDEAGNTVLSQYGDPSGISIDLGIMSVPGEVQSTVLPGEAERRRSSGMLATAPFVQSPDTGVVNIDQAQRAGERSQVSAVQPMTSGGQSAAMTEVATPTYQPDEGVLTSGAPQFDTSWLTDNSWMENSVAFDSGFTTAPQFTPFSIPVEPQQQQQVITEPGNDAMFTA